MRKGQPRCDWTTGEIRYLREHAGKVPLREICRHLRRSTRSVAVMAGRMRLSLRCYTSKLVWCPRCAAWRESVSAKTGHCRICAKRDALERAKLRTAAAYAKLPAAKKLVIDEKMSKYSSDPGPRPVHPAPFSGSHYANQKAEEEYSVALERWELGRLTKLVDNEKSRLRNIRKMLDAEEKANE